MKLSPPPAPDPPQPQPPPAAPQAPANGKPWMRILKPDRSPGSMREESLADLVKALPAEIELLYLGLSCGMAGWLACSLESRYNPRPALSADRDGFVGLTRNTVVLLALVLAVIPTLVALYDRSIAGNLQAARRKPAPRRFVWKLTLTICGRSRTVARATSPSYTTWMPSGCCSPHRGGTTKRWWTLRLI